MPSDSRESAYFDAELHIASAGGGLRPPPPPAKGLRPLCCCQRRDTYKPQLYPLKHVELSVATPEPSLGGTIETYSSLEA
jgi:hypothetical protein